ncbi:MAG: hypothetical protein AB1635_07560 [Acidobacteriota bacterium]
MAALLVTALAAALALALAVAVSMEHLAARNHAEAAVTLLAAEAGLEAAARDLAGRDDWSPVLAGAERAPASDDVTAGPLALPWGARLDVARETARLTCGRTAGCTDGQRRAPTAERPWGANNPRWQPFLAAPLARLLPAMPGSYVVVWVGDDVLEEDGRPDRDEAQPGAPGRFVARLHALALRPRGARRAVEAVIARPCAVDNGNEVCGPGIRVQSWHEVRPEVP